MTPAYTAMLARPASEGHICRVCGGPTENVVIDGPGVPRAYPCGPECNAKLREAVRDHTHRNCCPPGGPYCRLLRPRRPQPVIAAEASDGPLADAADAMQAVAHELERANAARREWQASRQQQRREPVPADAQPARVESYGQYRRRQRGQGGSA